MDGLDAHEVIAPRGAVSVNVRTFVSAVLGRDDICESRAKARACKLPVLLSRLSLRRLDLASSDAHASQRQHSDGGTDVTAVPATVRWSHDGRKATSRSMRGPLGPLSLTAMSMTVAPSCDQRDLIRKAQREQRVQRLRALAEDGLASGPDTADTDDDWVELRAIADGQVIGVSVTRTR